MRIAEALLSDLSAFKGFLHYCDDLLEVLRAYEQEQFEDWSRDILSGLADPKSGIRLETAHLDFSFQDEQEDTRATQNSLFIIISFSTFVKGTLVAISAGLS